MKIGLLECDHVAEPFRHLNGDYRDMFPALFPDLHFELFDVCNGYFPASVDECDAYMCTGSKYSVYDDLPWISDLKAFVRKLHDAGKPYVGVCFGHQLLAEALGGKVEKAPGGWCIGVHAFEVIRPESWMNDFQPGFNLLMLCQDQVQRLPPGSTVLARGTDCPIGMFRVGEHMLGLQAHPEFSKPYNRAVFESRTSRIGAGKVQAAVESLTLPTHSPEIARWILRFLRGNRKSEI